jgi:hypothetical protein
MAGRNLLAPAAQEAPKKGRNLLEGAALASPTPEGEVGWLTPVDDAMRIAADSMTRGYADKLGGEEAQQHTARSRERTSDWIETPIDIAASVAASPYRIGSAGVGALAGAAEGAASAYGHQEGWVPGWDVLKGAAVGAATGGLGAKVGGWLGGGKAVREAEAARPYKTDADLKAASVADPSNLDLGARLSHVNMIRDTQGTTRDTFAKMLSGMEGASPEVQAKIAEIAGGKSLTSKAGELVPNVLTEGGLDRTLAVGLTLGPKAAAARVGAQALKSAGKSDWANRVPDKLIDELAVQARSGELKLDPATIDKWRDAAAKIGIGYGRSP